jgi:hypothetical protein
MITVPCPYCGRPLREREEFFQEWEIRTAADGALVYADPSREDGLIPFKYGSCTGCGEFVDQSGAEGRPAGA